MSRNPPGQDRQGRLVAETIVRYRTVDVGGNKIFYREAGRKDAPALLLLHGFPTASHMFRDLIPLLADRFRLVAPDLPGFGQSDMPSRTSFSYTFNNLAQVIDQFVDIIGLSRFALYIFDYGAPVGLRIALNHPERITAIISQNGNAYEEGLSAGWNSLREYWQKPTSEGREALRSAFALETHSAEIAAIISDFLERRLDATWDESARTVPTTSLKRDNEEIAIGAIHAVAEAQFLGPQQVNQLPSTLADYRIQYGSDPLQFGDLRLPKTSERPPVAVVIHGGCWKARVGNLIADLQNTAALSSALTSVGIATWNIEYRRIDNPGGGWTGTFEDVANAVDYLRVLAKSYPLDLKRVAIIGHSAGGHLGTWAAARHRLPEQSPLFSKKPLGVVGVVNLAGPADLESFLPIQNQVCGGPVVTNLIGGSPSEVPDRYRQASPSNLLPIGVKQVLITGVHDKVVPPELGKKYEEKAKGDDVRFIAVESAAHFEVITPGSIAWPKVEEAVLSILR